MTFFRTIAAAACLLACVTCSHAQQQPGRTDLSPTTASPEGEKRRQGKPAAPAKLTYDFTAFEAAAADYLKETKLPGAGVIVIHHGEVVYEKYFGEYTKTTVIPIASASKWISGAAVMSLVDEGKLSLDDPVSKFIPEFTGDKAAITVRMLWNHTSGLPSDDSEAQRWGSTTTAAGARIATLKMVSVPGEVFKYGGVSMQAGARVAEVAGGEDWKTLFAERIATPVGMSNTQYGRIRLATNPQVAGGASSTAPDYAAFLKMLLNKGKVGETVVLSEASVKELISDHTKDARVGQGNLRRRANGGGYAVGCWVEKRNDEGETVIASSPGAFGFRPWIDLDRDAGFVWMIEDRKRDRRKGAAARFDVKELLEAAIDAAKPIEGDRMQKKKN